MSEVFPEIGSEFWLESTLFSREKGFSLVPEGFDCHYLLSGRTALAHIIDDIIKERGKAFHVCLPSYCCHSMVEPFLAVGCRLSFYNVIAGKNGLDCMNLENSDYEVIYLLDYFGFSSRKLLDNIHQAKSDGKTVILDRTHSSFMEWSEVERETDYAFASLRKWFFSNAAIASKNGAFVVLPCHTINAEYEKLRNCAANEKREYLFNTIGEKDVFLEHFAQAEEMLEASYRDFAANEIERERILHVNREVLRKRRRRNANMLLEALSQQSVMTPLFPEMSPQDIPLFVPVLLSSQAERDALRKHLINHSIYCPVHWPKPSIISSIDGGLYERSLSLVCDQRYGEMDMRRFITVLNDFIDGK